LQFTELQQRLGRKQQQLDFWQADVPVVYVAFDLLYRDGRLLLDAPLKERRRELEDLVNGDPGSEPAIVLSPALVARQDHDLQSAFEAALARGNEGLMAKAPNSSYTPGRRGRAWLKLKQPLATLDVVVTSVEYGHGKRRGVLSDYTFSIRASPAEDKLLT